MRHIIAVILAVTTGCGLTMTRGPSASQRPDQRPDCTESFAAPKRDAYGAILGLVSIFFGVFFVKAGENDAIGAPLIVGGAIAMAGSYASGGIGYYRVKKCRGAIRDFERRNPPAITAPDELTGALASTRAPL